MNIFPKAIVLTTKHCFEVKRKYHVKARLGDEGNCFRENLHKCYRLCNSLTFYLCPEYPHFHICGLQENFAFCLVPTLLITCLCKQGHSEGRGYVGCDTPSFFRKWFFYNMALNYSRKVKYVKAYVSNIISISMSLCHLSFTYSWKRIVQNLEENFLF